MAGRGARAAQPITPGDRLPRLRPRLNPLRAGTGAGAGTGSACGPPRAETGWVSGFRVRGPDLAETGSGLAEPGERLSCVRCAAPGASATFVSCLAPARSVTQRAAAACVCLCGLCVCVCVCVCE